MLDVSDLNAAAKAYRSQMRCDMEFHKAVQKFTESSGFNGFIIFIIFVNAFFMALETYPTIEEDCGIALNIIDYIFLGIYTVEFFLKVYAEPLNYWKNAYNIFDFLVLVLSWIGGCITWSNSAGDSKLETLKVLRALRTLRTLRTVSFIRGLQVLVTALLDTLRKWVFNILALLLLLMFLFAIIGYYFFGYPENNSDKKNWGTLGRAMLSLFSFVTVDGWTDIQYHLDELTSGSRSYTILFIFLGHFIFTNVFIGVVIINISEAADNYKLERRIEREAVVKHKKEFMLMRQHNDVKQLMERQKKGAYANFAEMVTTFETGLRHEDFRIQSDLCTNLLWMETFINSLDHMDNRLFRCQQLHFEISLILAEAFERKQIQKQRQKSAPIKRRQALLKSVLINKE